MEQSGRANRLKFGVRESQYLLLSNGPWSVKTIFSLEVVQSQSSLVVLEISKT
jgi:hypothetical protein